MNRLSRWPSLSRMSSASHEPIEPESGKESYELRHLGRPVPLLHSTPAVRPQINDARSARAPAGHKHLRHRCDAEDTPAGIGMIWPLRSRRSRSTGGANDQPCPAEWTRTSCATTNPASESGPHTGRWCQPPIPRRIHAGGGGIRPSRTRRSMSATDTMCMLPTECTSTS